MNRHTALVATLGLALATNLVTAGDITGTVTLKGTPPKEKDITPLKGDPNCGKFHTAMPTTKFYVVGPSSGLADVVVSIQGISGKSSGASASPVVMDQKNCIYVPQILAVQTGQKLVVKNSDPVLHNVHSQPTVPGNPEDNKAQMPNGPDLTFTFPKAEEFLKFKCDVHPWMFAWVSVFDHPYYAVSTEDGSFKIANVPPGKYKIKAIHRKAGEVTKDIEVKDDGAKVDFTLDAK